MAPHRISYKTLYYAIASTWIMYLFCITAGKMDGAPPAVWVLILASVIGTTAATFLALGYDKRRYNIFLIIAMALLFFVYLGHWYKSAITVRLPSEEFAQILSIVIRVKLRLIAHLFEAKGVFEATRQVYWEIMPFLQLAIIPMWVLARKVQARTPE